MPGKTFQDAVSKVIAMSIAEKEAMESEKNPNVVYDLGMGEM